MTGATQTTSILPLTGVVSVVPFGRRVSVGRRLTGVRVGAAVAVAPSGPPTHTADNTNGTIDTLKVNTSNDRRKTPTYTKPIDIDTQPSSMMTIQSHVAPRSRSRISQFKPPNTTIVPSTDRRATGTGTLPRIVVAATSTTTTTPTIISPTSANSIPLSSPIGSITSSVSKRSSARNSGRYGSNSLSSSAISSATSSIVSPSDALSPSSTQTRVFTNQRPASPAGRLPTLQPHQHTNNQIVLPPPALNTNAPTSSTAPSSVQRLISGGSSSTPLSHRRLLSGNGPVVATALPSRVADHVSPPSVQPPPAKQHPVLIIRKTSVEAVSPPNEVVSSRSDTAKSPDSVRKTNSISIVTSNGSSTVNTHAPNSPATNATSITVPTVSTTPTSTNPPSGVVSPTSFLNQSQIYTDANPEFVEYKKRWETMRAGQTAFMRAGGFKDGRSLLSPVGSQAGTRAHSRAESLCTSPRALSPFSPMSDANMHTSMTYPPTSPTSSLRSPPGGDGITSFDFPVPLPVDELGEELATTCSPMPGPFVHSGSLFAILVESNRSSPLPDAGVPGFKILTDAQGRPLQTPSPVPNTNGHHHHQRARSVMINNIPSPMTSARVEQKGLVHARHGSMPFVSVSPNPSIPEESGAPSTIINDTSMNVNTTNNTTKHTDWNHVERRLNGLAVTAHENAPSPPPIIANTHGQVGFTKPAPTLPPSANTTGNVGSSALPPRAPSPLPLTRARITVIPPSCMPSSISTLPSPSNMSGVVHHSFVRPTTSTTTTTNIILPIAAAVNRNEPVLKGRRNGLTNHVANNIITTTSGE